MYDLMEQIENEAPVHTVVFDFASVPYIDSTGIKYLKVYATNICYKNSVLTIVL